MKIPREVGEEFNRQVGNFHKEVESFRSGFWFWTGILLGFLLGASVVPLVLFLFKKL